MLVNLQQLDIGVRHNVRHSCADDQCAAKRPRRQIASEGMRQEDKDAGTADERQDDNDVAVETVDQHDLMADHWYELENDQERCWQDGEL